MKKKFLSLMMAAAVVATTSVSAFATTTEITGDETREQTTNIDITGDVENQKGEIKPGTLSVTVPTTAAFRVSKEGNLEGSTMEVVNRGTQEIEIFVTEFIDVNGNDGIKVVSAEKTSKPKTETDAVDRSNVSLMINGNGGTAYLGTRTSNDTGTGVFSDRNLIHEETNGKKISQISAKGTDKLKLSGKAGQKTDQINDAIRDDFTLKLMVRKKPVTNNASGDSHTSSDSQTDHRE